MPATESLEQRIARIRSKVLDRNITVTPCASEAEVAGFEHRYGISLPEDYRAFLLSIACGASGPPHYGLIPWPNPNVKPDTQADIDISLPKIKLRFPFTKPWVWESGDLSDDGTEDQIHNGQLYLGTDGCAMNWYLIVTGPERGHIWHIVDVGMQPTVPKRDFLQWFEDWLDGDDNRWNPQSEPKKQ